jgi:hypothetical protein
MYQQKLMSSPFIGNLQTYQEAYPEFELWTLLENIV